ncbi:MAG: alpha/beta fold hydrolase [Pseudomonadales bacterium]
MQQRIAFVRSKDSTNIAYALSGEGPPLVKAGTWMTHVHHDWNSPVWAHWLHYLSSRHTLVRYDPRGTGLSQTDVGQIKFSDWVDDLEAVVDKLELERFPLLGLSQGAAVSVEYAVRHPDRVSQLILYAPHVTGWSGRKNPWAAQWAAMEQLVSTGWGEGNMAFASMFANLFLPDSSAETRQWYAELQTNSATKEVASQFMAVLSQLSVFSKLKELRVPTLVIQVAREQVINPSMVIDIASEIPGAQFASIDSGNHLLLEDEPGWQEFKKVLAAFLPVPNQQIANSTAADPARLDSLSKREMQIFTEVARGLNNREIADNLFISEKTVRNHITHVFDKLGVNSRSQAIVMAKALGI